MTFYRKHAKNDLFIKLTSKCLFSKSDIEHDNGKESPTKEGLLLAQSLGEFPGKLPNKIIGY